MNAYFPDTETMRTVLTLAARAPSVYNTQPWRWQVGDETLHLYVDPSLQLHNTDPDGRDLILSCGATLNHCVIALAALGWRCKAHRLPDPADDDRLAAIEVSGRRRSGRCCVSRGDTAAANRPAATTALGRCPAMIPS